MSATDQVPMKRLHLSCRTWSNRTNRKSLGMRCNSQPRPLVCRFRHSPAWKMTFCVSGFVALGTSNHLRCTSEKAPQQKSRGFLLCFFPAGTLPQVLCQIQTYCSGVSVPAQVEAKAVVVRTTASATEQNPRTPVVFTVTGVAQAA